MANLQHQSSFEVWNNFFHSAGIPGSVSHDYAMKFSQHRIRIDMLQEISKDILIDMGIKAMGDIIAILRHAKSICAQNELKPSGIVKSLGQPNHMTSSSTLPAANNNNTNHHSANQKNLSQRMPIITNQSSLKLAPAMSGPNVGNKIQSRLNLRSGAVIASSNNNNGYGSSSNISSSLAKRLAPPADDRKLNLELAEKTLTVHYPSRAAIAKAAQRISGQDSNLNNHQRDTPPTTSIKSRLGSIRSNSGGKYESNSGNTIKIQGNNHISKPNNRSTSSSRTSSRDIVSSGRRHESRQSNDRISKTSGSGSRHANGSRLKSTVFSRLGQSAR